MQLFGSIWRDEGRFKACAKGSLTLLKGSIPFK